MDSPKLHVMAAVSSYWLLGDIPAKGVRLQEILKDRTTDFVTLSDVQVHSHAKRKCLSTLSNAIVPKSQIEILIVPSDKHEAPEKRWNNFTSKTAVQVFAVVGEYCIEGILELPTQPTDILFTLTHQLGSFFPLTHASLSGPDVKQLSVPLLFINKDFLKCFHFGKPADTVLAKKQQASPQSQETHSQETHSQETHSQETHSQETLSQESNPEEETLETLAENLEGLLGEVQSNSDANISEHSV